MPSSWARPTTERTICSAPLSEPIESTKDLSILSASPGKPRSTVSDAAPVPKSSRCARTPVWANSASSASRTAAASAEAAVSVISRRTASGSMP